MNITNFDPSKPVVTRAGKPATILFTDLKSEQYPIAARFFDQSGEELVSCFTKNGCYSNDAVEDPNDLLNVGERITATAVLNIYPGGVVKAYPNQMTADAWAQNAALGARITSIEVNIDIPQP